MKKFRNLFFRVCVLLNILLTGSLCVNAEASSAATDMATEGAADLSYTGANWDWGVIIGVSCVISFIIAVILAVRKADKVFGKDSEL